MNKNDNLQNQLIDEKIINLTKKFNIPKNPLSFYLNIVKIEKNLSEFLKEYFYKAINEFIAPQQENINLKNKSKCKNINMIKPMWYSNFLVRIYYYTWFTKQLAKALQLLLDELKYYDVVTYLQCAVYFDNTLKIKVSAILNNKPKVIDQLSTKSRKELIKEYPFLDEIPSIKDLSQKLNNYILHASEKELRNFYKLIEVNITNHPSSYNESKLTFNEYYKKYCFYYDALNICFSNIVTYFDRQRPDKINLFVKILSKVWELKKYYFIYNWLMLKNKIKAQKYFLSEYSKYFNSKNELTRYIITYLINLKHNKFKKLFYWQAIKERLNEDEWAKIWWINLFYIQKLDSLSWFNMFLFFKQFKDTLINLYNSLFWPFIKPYFYYILIFRSIKLPLKDWQKLFFLLMFFSSESYEEYTILQRIYLSVKNIWIWNWEFYQNKFLYYIKRFFNLFKEFFASGFLFGILLVLLWQIWLINIIMLIIIWVLLVVSFLRYLFFPHRFVIVRTLSIILISILGYIWFSTIFPKITNPQYISYVWQQVQSLVDLNFSWANKNYNKMISMIYWDNYKNFEKKLISDIFHRWTEIKNNKTINKIVKTTTKIMKKITYRYVKLKRWKYLKYYIDKEIDKYQLSQNKKNRISKKVIFDYINRYCWQYKNFYCKTRLEKLPVWFKINLTKIEEFVQKELE